MILSTVMIFYYLLLFYDFVLMKQVDLAVELLEDLLDVIQVCMCVCWKLTPQEQWWETNISFNVCNLAYFVSYL
jgi:hypothetical protein